MEFAEGVAVAVEAVAPGCFAVQAVAGTGVGIGGVLVTILQQGAVAVGVLVVAALTPQAVGRDQTVEWVVAPAA